MSESRQNQPHTSDAPAVDPVRIADNLAALRARMAEVAAGAGRRADEIKLVAVSKTHPFAAIEAAYAAGQRDFGENRVEELWPKVEAAQAAGLDEIRWHLIGTVQSRKSSMAVGPFALIHSVDRMKIANRISRDAEAADQVMDVLLEVNVSGEESKHGFSPDEVMAHAAELERLPGIRVRGLMTMAPFSDDTAVVRPVFRGLAALRQRLAEATPAYAWPELSMGMTNDYEVAIEEGATLIRVGSAIFGARATP